FGFADVAVNAFVGNHERHVRILGGWGRYADKQRAMPSSAKRGISSRGVFVCRAAISCLTKRNSGQVHFDYSIIAASEFNMIEELPNASQ
ncbi:MAG TPA: hypothetical protein PKN64_03770, partial [Casimicrobium sp.]|nr:hypothetical protein [Casimicrobium sp.]